eukprot:maker-scaffold_1-snap-gene-2.5-mRNA-1 protein AED:0.01 eAED:0.01 QI:0/0.5/0.33/1/1/1/3/11/805
MSSDQKLAAAQATISKLESELSLLREQLSLQATKTTETSELKRAQQRLTKSAGKEIENLEGRIGMPFEFTENPDFLQPRISFFEELYARKQKEIEEKEKLAISITLPDGSIHAYIFFFFYTGNSWETSPFSLLQTLDPEKKIIPNAIVAKVKYTKRFSDEEKISSGQDELEEAFQNQNDGELWDLKRPLEGDCFLEILDFNSSEARMVFWHSSAHLLGECLECKLGSHLTVGPPIQSGFYYDSYIGENGLDDSKIKQITKTAQKMSKQKQEFQRLVLTKDEALEMFKYNPYKTSIIRNKVKDGSLTSVYRNGPFVDLCMGPHIMHTGMIKAIEVTQATSAYWLGQEGNDKLQRVYGVSFPDKGMLKNYKEMKKRAALNDHRKKGVELDLFFFHQMSPGSCFWSAAGAKIYNKLVRFIQDEERLGGYQEVITPNVYSSELWKISGHWEHYKDNMFTFTDGEHKSNIYGLKPMNCPGHCLIFDNRVRSYRDLPIRMADFGVLHRNEASGALSGLTRVRRFQQDDGHIFCREDQVADEVLQVLKLIKKVYDIFGLKMKVKRSTRPAKAVGLKKEDGSVDEDGVKLWDTAEAALAVALDNFVGKGNWSDKIGDGAFYGPKIDIQITDVMEREHQCATVQLDFQLPRRFGLKYKGKDTDAGEGNYETPVIIHRAILGSLERMIAILTEHFAAKWPFWMSPRQIMIIPVAQSYFDYAQELKQTFFAAGFEVDVDLSTKTLNKKILLAQKEQYNFMLVVGEKEFEGKSVNIRTRRNNRLGEMPVDEALSLFKKYCDERLLDEIVDPIKPKEK